MDVPLLSLLLAQAQLPHGVGDSNISNPALYLLVLAAALPAIAGLAVNFFQWLGKRAVDRQDKDQEELKKKQGDLDERISALDKALTELRSDGKFQQAAVVGLQSSVSELRMAFDTRLEKQGDFYRAALKEHQQNVEELIEKSEQNLRHDMTRAVADSLGRKG